MSEFYGLTEDEIIEQVANGSNLAEIAASQDKDRSTLSKWISSDNHRSARVNMARQRSAAVWDERAEQRIDSALDPFELAKAKELAHHYRWRASKIAPREYGDKTETVHSGTVTVEAIKRTIYDPLTATVIEADTPKVLE